MFFIYFSIKNLNHVLIKTPSYMDIFGIVLGGGGYILAVSGWWWMVVNIFWLLVDDGGEFWVVVGNLGGCGWL